MVSQCANPECGAQFLYFGEGELVAVPRRERLLTDSRVEFFWLCGNCASHLHLEVAVDGAMNLVSRRVLQTA
ncbi:MAG TPA: hypothetical protein VKY85_25820 [Candidatus Angelobacter sp.]|nr:hypothetical protein [Candidatus Angelobacter sp.]